MNFTGVFQKMQTEFANPIQYFLVTDSSFIQLNQLINTTIKLKHVGYQCFNCGEDLEIFGMGYCRSCFFKVPQTQQFVLRPELSKAHLGEEEIDLEWEQKMQLQPHIVYLANGGNLKVGVTRKTQIPTRWIDQGASYALPILEVENRYLAGVAEIALSAEISDKTNFRKMLTNSIPEIDLVESKHKLEPFIPKELQKDILSDDQPTELIYPVEKYPTKITSLNFKKHPNIEGKLIGIRGQYLLLEGGLVFNVRSHEGFRYELELA